MLLAALWVVLGFWVLRGVNVFLSWKLIPSLKPAPARKPDAPFLSVIVPARNEERDIGDATRAKLSCEDPVYEVVVVEDRSTDGTLNVLRRLEREFPGRLRVVDGVEPPPDWLGKPHAMHEGARVARATRPGDWLLFSDADVHFGPDLLARAFAHVDKEKLDFLTLFPTLEAKTFGERLMMPTLPAYGFCYLPGWLMNLPNARLFGGGGGVFNLIRRDLFDRIGGHEALKSSVVDDIQLGRNARLAGGRTGFALALDSVSLRMYHGFRETSDGFAKNFFFGIGGNLPVAVLIILLSFLEGELPFVVLLGGALGALFTFEEVLISSLVVALIFLVRGALHLHLRYPPANVFLHPLWAAAVAGIFARSTWVNGVLHRNVWRGRERDARTLRI